MPKFHCALFLDDARILEGDVKSESEKKAISQFLSEEARRLGHSYAFLASHIPGGAGYVAPSEIWDTLGTVDDLKD